MCYGGLELSHSNRLHAALELAIRGLAAAKDVETALIAGRDGLLVVGGADQGEAPELRAALSAAAFGAIDRALSTLDLGPARATLVETPTHTMQIVGVAGLLLVVIAKRAASVSHIRDQMAKTASIVARLAST